MTPLELVHLLEQPMKLCSYCANVYTSVDTYEWKQISKKYQERRYFVPGKRMSDREIWRR